MLDVRGGNAEYDGLNRRIVHGRSDYYYNEGWQVLEVRRDGAATALDQYVWDQRYVDAPVLRWYDLNGDGDFLDAEETLYYTNDANMNVTALIDADTGHVVERYAYDPYGRPLVLNGADGTDPDVNGSTVYEWDVDADGKSDVDNQVLFAGYRYDPDSGLYHVRNRSYDPSLGRFLQRDPDGYGDGMSLYEYCRSGPLGATDPMGTDSQPRVNCACGWSGSGADLQQHLWRNDGLGCPLFRGRGPDNSASSFPYQPSQAAPRREQPREDLKDVRDYTEPMTPVRDPMSPKPAPDPSESLPVKFEEWRVRTGTNYYLNSDGYTGNLTDLYIKFGIALGVGEIAILGGPPAVLGLIRVGAPVLSWAWTGANAWTATQLTLHAATLAKVGFYTFVTGAGFVLGGGAYGELERSRVVPDRGIGAFMQWLGLAGVNLGPVWYETALPFRTPAPVRTPGGEAPIFRTWNQFQAGTKGQFPSRADAAAGWSVYKEANGLVTAMVRSQPARAQLLRALADDYRTPSWMRQWFRNGRVPPGYEVDHIVPLSIGGAATPENVRLQGIDLHRLWHKRYRPWEW